MLMLFKLLILPGVLRDTSFRLPCASCAWQMNTVNTARGMRAPPTPVLYRPAGRVCQPNVCADLGIIATGTPQHSMMCVQSVASHFFVPTLSFIHVIKI